MDMTSIFNTIEGKDVLTEGEEKLLEGILNLAVFSPVIRDLSALITPLSDLDGWSGMIENYKGSEIGGRSTQYIKEEFKNRHSVERIVYVYGKHKVGERDTMESLSKEEDALLFLKLLCVVFHVKRKTNGKGQQNELKNA